MLSSRLLAKPCSRNGLAFSRTVPNPLLQLPRRTYVHSRFPDKVPGSSRKRERIERVHPRRATQSEEPESWFNFAQEQKPSVEQSDLWEASRRTPTGDPEEGLRRLLLGNEVLVVTRFARSTSEKYQVLKRSLDKSRCSISSSDSSSQTNM